ncbi:MAG: P-type conjugative transfer ATPase TrbB, partial [Parvibaculum sp.]|nr:P-type conjugative transfer ATPase TrbB [Parvibaculum sp.]
YRLEQLVQEASAVVPRRLIAEAIDLVAFIEGRGAARHVGCIAQVTGLDTNGDYLVTETTSPHRPSV